MRNWFKEISLTFQRADRFVGYEIWQIGKPGEEIPKGFVTKQIRVAILLFSNLLMGTVLLRSAALTLATILSIVPFFAIMFYLIQVFNVDDTVFNTIQRWVEEHVPAEVASVSTGPAAAPSVELVDAPPSIIEDPAPELPPIIAPQTDPLQLEDSLARELGTVPLEFTEKPDSLEKEAPETDLLLSTNSDSAFETQLRHMLFRDVGQNQEYRDPIDLLFNLAQDFAEDASRNPRGPIVAGIILVFTTVIGLLRNIENAFNTIWGVRRTRPWYRMISDYLMITLLLPFVGAAVLGVNAALQNDAVLERLGPLSIAVHSFQYLIIWLVFSLFYFAVPNTSVKFRFALLGGIVAGTLWVLLSFIYVRFQIGLSHYGLVFSTFAQFPLLVVWIYLSWSALLFGVEISFAYQNERTFAMERFAEGASSSYREALGLRAMIEVARRFENGMPGLVAEAAAHGLNAPTRLLNDTLWQLEDAGLIVACQTEPVSYQPARPPSAITSRQVLDALRDSGREPSALREEPELSAILDETKAGTAHSLAELAARMPAPSEGETSRILFQGKRGASRKVRKHPHSRRRH